MLSFIGQINGTELIAIMLALAIVLVFSFSLHEFGHAFVAYKLGDVTPKTYGRLSINPLKHMDPIGFVCCFLFGFGWAKPVPINPLNFRNYKKSDQPNIILFRLRVLSPLCQIYNKHKLLYIPCYLSFLLYVLNQPLSCCI